MKCKNRIVKLVGCRHCVKPESLSVQVLECLITNDELGKTLSINDGNVQFTVPFEPLEKYLMDGGED